MDLKSLGWKFLSKETFGDGNNYHIFVKQFIVIKWKFIHSLHAVKAKTIKKKKKYIKIEYVFFSSNGSMA